MNTYLKDGLRIATTAATSAGVVVGTSNSLERGLTFALLALALVGSFLFDSTDPRNHARAIKLLGLEGQVSTLLHVGGKVIPGTLGTTAQNAETALDNVEADTKDGEAKVTLDDLVKNEASVSPDAKPAVLGIPPKDQQGNAGGSNGDVATAETSTETTTLTT